MSNISEIVARLRTIAALSELAKDDFADGALDHVVPLETRAADALQQQAERITAQDVKCRLYEAALDKADKEADGLRAARIAYASEFPPDAEGLPDVGSIHANIRAMKRDAARYRWWVEFVFRAGNDGYPTCTYLADVEDPADISAAIDAAIVEQSKGEPK